MNDDTNNENASSELDDFIKRLDISLAELEELGLTFLLVGYSNFYIGADLDILEALDINNTGQHPDIVTLWGQNLVLIGYIFLWIVSTKRVEEKSFRTDSENNEIYIIEPYIQISQAYLLSVFANYLRVVAFQQIAINNATNVTPNNLNTINNNL